MRSAEPRADVTGQVLALTVAGAVGDAHVLASAARRVAVIARATVGVAGAAQGAHTIGIVARARGARGTVGAGGALAGHAIAMRPAEICFGNAQPVLWAIRGHGTGIAHLASGIAALTHRTSGHWEASRASRAAGVVETSGYAYRPREERTDRLAHVAGSARGTFARIAGPDADRPIVAWDAQGSGPARAVLTKDRAAGQRTVARAESDGRRHANGRQAGQRGALAAVRAGAAGQNRARQGLSIGPGRQGVGPTRSRIGRRWQRAAIGRRPRGVLPASDRCVRKTTVTPASLGRKIGASARPPVTPASLGRETGASGLPGRTVPASRPGLGVIAASPGTACGPVSAGAPLSQSPLLGPASHLDPSAPGPHRHPIVPRRPRVADHWGRPGNHRVAVAAQKPDAEDKDGFRRADNEPSWTQQAS